MWCGLCCPRQQEASASECSCIHALALGWRSVQVVEDGNGNVKIKCPNAGKDFAAEEISALVLRKLTGDAAKFLNDKVDKAVITVSGQRSGERVGQGRGGVQRCRAAFLEMGGCRLSGAVGAKRAVPTAALVSQSQQGQPAGV
jgi:molecular chaperone DnaK (HSP70)